jgi:alpha-tubulin suppressor-like RCC1 family protein
MASALALLGACGSGQPRDPALSPSNASGASEAGVSASTPQACERSLVADAASCAPPTLSTPTLQIAVDSMHACAWRRSGPVSCWGRNGTGELGDPSLQDHALPTVVPNLHDVLQVTVGDWGLVGFSCALLADHTVSCWGANQEGQLGDGTISPYRATPAPIANLADVVEIATGSHHTCARLSNGEVRCWGMGRACGIGDGQCEDRLTPVSPYGLADVAQLALGMTFSCARKNDRTLLCWGANGDGEVGVGSQIGVLVPTQVPGLTGVVRISASNNNPCAQTADGRVFCWGVDQYGWLGNCSSTYAVTTPVEAHGVPCGGALMPGSHCVVTATNAAACWGTWSGDGSYMPHTEGAVPVPLSGIVATAGYRSLFAIGLDGRVWSWGYNESGQLGDGTTANRWTPMAIQAPP